MGKEEQSRKPEQNVLKKYGPLIGLILVLGLFFAYDLQRFIGFEQIKTHQDVLMAYVDQYPILSAAVFIVLYTVVVAASLPIASILTIVGGYLFGLVFGSLYVLTGATVGATLIFLAARSALGGFLRDRAKGWVQRLREGFQHNAVSYMLFLRLIPLFPFFVVNVVPAVLGVRLSIYFWATLFGIIPGTVVYVSLGRGLGQILAAGKTPDLGFIFQIDILLPIVGIALLSLLPVGWRKWKTRHQQHNTDREANK